MKRYFLVPLMTWIFMTDYPRITVQKEEPDFVEVPIGPGMLSQPTQNKARTAEPMSQVSKAFLYAGGMLVSAVLGGFVALNVIEWDGSTATSDTTPNHRVEKRRASTPADSPEVVMKNSTDPDPVLEDTEFDKARDLKQVVEDDDVESAFSKKPAKDVVNVRPFEKRQTNKRIKRKPVRKSKRKTVQKEELPTRPRYVKDIIIYY